MEPLQWNFPKTTASSIVTPTPFTMKDAESQDPETAVRVNGSVVHVPGALGRAQVCTQHAVGEPGEPALEVKEALR